MGINSARNLTQAMCYSPDPHVFLSHAHTSARTAKTLLGLSSWDKAVGFNAPSLAQRSSQQAETAFLLPHLNAFKLSEVSPLTSEILWQAFYKDTAPSTLPAARVLGQAP